MDSTPVCPDNVLGHRCALCVSGIDSAEPVCLAWEMAVEEVNGRREDGGILWRTIVKTERERLPPMWQELVNALVA